MKAKAHVIRLGSEDRFDVVCPACADKRIGAASFVDVDALKHQTCDDCRGPMWKKRPARRNPLRKAMLAAGALVVAGQAHAHEMVCRVTYYSKEEVGGRKTSTGCRPVEGVTVAVDPRLIKYGQTVEIPALRGLVGDGLFVATDTGSAVKSRKAAKRQGRNVPVVDVFLDNADRVKQVTKALGKDGHFLKVRVL